jgi:hypothetical protein
MAKTVWAGKQKFRFSQLLAGSAKSQYDEPDLDKS